MLVVISAQTRETFVGHQTGVELNDDRPLVLIHFHSKAIGEIQIENISVMTSNGQTRWIARHVV